jgi:hypothetical protein
MQINPALILFLITALCSNAFSQSLLKPTLIESTTPFSQNGTVEFKESNYSNKPEVNKLEYGSMNGVYYEFFYTDGSGTFAGKPNAGKNLEIDKSNWVVTCKKDVITDKKHCRMKIRDLWIYAFPNARFIVSVGKDHYPSSTVTIRIAQGNPITQSSANDGNFSQSASMQIVRELKSAKTVTTRYMEWPYRTWEDESWDLYGYNEALAYISWAVGRIR